MRRSLRYQRILSTKLLDVPRCTVRANLSVVALSHVKERGSATGPWKQPLTIGALVATVVCGAVVGVRFLVPTGGTTGVDSATSRIVADARSYATAGLVSRTLKNGRTLVVFTDFGCRYCKLLEDALLRIEEDSINGATIVYRHFPLRGITFEAAAAAECANVQGRFADMKKVLFAGGQELGMRRWVDLAQEAGVPDTSAFAACLVDPRTVERVDADVKAGERLLLRGTPAVLVGATLYEGRPPEAVLREAVRRLPRMPNGRK